MAGLFALTAIVSACSTPPEADCQPIGERLLWQIASQTSTTVHDAYASPSTVEDGVWLVSASTDEGTAVWTSSTAPEGEETSFIFPANDAARADSITTADVESQSELLPGMKARTDADDIATAVACVPEG